MLTHGAKPKVKNFDENTPRDLLNEDNKEEYDRLVSEQKLYNKLEFDDKPVYTVHLTKENIFPIIMIPLVIFFTIFVFGYTYHCQVKTEFESSLAIPGEAGTMRNRTVGTLAEKKLRAKTGSMNNVSTLAGYVTTRDGETLCFAIMMNNFTVPEALARNLQDLICMRLASFSRRS